MRTNAPLSSPTRPPARRRRPWLALVLAAAGLFGMTGVPPSRAAVVTDSQTFTIQPGWNAVYLEVSPSNPDPATVFSSLAGVQQVWSFLAPKSSVQYISDPTSGLFNVPGWKVWLPADPANPQNAALTNLLAVIGHQAYLIKYGGTAAATLTVSGPAGFHAVNWQPDGFTLAGVPVNPASTVLAGDYFTNDAAHKGQTRYYLAATGTWLPLADTAALKRGQAYWFYTKGPGSYQTAVDFNYGGGASLDYGSTGSQRTLAFTNRTTSSVEVTLTPPAGIPLSYQSTDPNTRKLTWTPLTSYVQTVAAGATQNLVVGVLRSQLPAGSDVGALCTLGMRAVATNGTTLKLDSLLKVPVTVQSLGLAGSAAGTNSQAGTSSQKMGGGSARKPTTSAGSPANPNAGLWVGTVTLNQIDEVNNASITGSGSPPTVTSVPHTGTPATFGLRLILHVDDGGTVELLKEVIVMQKKAASSDPGTSVLVTDPLLIPQFDAPSSRNDSPFAPRLSSVAFDFAGNNLPLGGSFGSTVTGTIAIPRTLPTNPFAHLYNPDHNDTSAASTTVWDVNRALTLAFNGSNPDASQPGADGSSQTGGNYTETITGLHRFPITVTGTFTLRRVNAIGALDPAP